MAASSPLRLPGSPAIDAAGMESVAGKLPADNLIGQLARHTSSAVKLLQRNFDYLGGRVSSLDSSVAALTPGNSPPAKLTFSIDGRLLIENDACPRSPITANISVTKIVLTLKSASVGGGVTVALKRVTTAWISATIPAGTTYYEVPAATISAAAQILANEWVRVDVSSVPSGAGTFPGSDISVTLYF